MILSIALPVLMVSRIKYESLPKPSMQTIKKNPIVFIILFIAIILTIATNGEGSFSFCLFYIFTGIIRTVKNMLFKKHRIIEEDITDENLELK
jgi:CDP-diacylglycerol--serine O-phosphatidyltransferase